MRLPARGRAPHRIQSRLAAVGCALVVSACSFGQPDPIVYDFVERRPFSQPLVEREVINIGTPDARALLVEGWHDHDERWARRTPFVWGVGDQSVIELPLVARRHLMVELMEAALTRPALLETSEAVIDAELEDRLRALGYVR
jgi:hypothetical protein